MGLWRYDRGSSLIIGDFYHVISVLPWSPENCLIHMGYHDIRIKKSWNSLWNSIWLSWSKQLLSWLKGQGLVFTVHWQTKKNPFKNANVFESDLCNHHLLINSMLKTSFQKCNPKRLVYIDYISFSDDCFLTNLSNSIENAQCYEAFEAKTVEVFDNHNKISKGKP